MKSSITRRSVKFSWALSYIMVLVVSLFVCIIAYLGIEKIIQTEINRSNDIFLKQVQQYIDSLVTDARLTGINIALSPQANNIMNIEKPLKSSDTQIINECIRMLKEYKLSNNTIHDIYIYLKNIDMVINDQGIESSKDYYNSLIYYNNLSYDEWINTLTQYYNGHYVTDVSGKAYNNTALEDISYIRSLPLLRPDKNNASVVVSINESKFLTMVENIRKEYNGEVLILDSSNSIVWSTPNLTVLPEGVKYEELNSDKRIISALVDGKKVVVSYIDSTAESWKYMLIIPTDVFWYKLTYSRRFIFFGIMLSALLCGVVTYVTLKKNYAPVYSLVNSISNQSDFSPDGQTDEYSYIQSAVKKIVDERNSIRLELIGQKAALRSHFFERLLKGRIREIPDDSIAALGIDFVSDSFGVMLFYIEDLDGDTLEYGESYDAEVYKLLQYITPDMLEKISENQCHAYITDVDDMIACIININSSSKDKADEVMTKLAQELYQYMLSKNNINITVALSNVHNNIMGIPEAYNEAMEVIEYKEVMGIKGIINYSRTQDNKDIEYYYPVEQEQKIINNIKLGEFTAIEEILNNIFDENFRKRNLPPHMAKYVMCNLLCTILKAMNDIGTTTEDSYLRYIIEFEKLIGQLMHNRNVSEIYREMVKEIKNVCESAGPSCRPSGKSQHIRDDIEKYIMENYMDVNLCISSIGDHFKMNPSYISKLYKTQSGKSILDYINKVRIDRAKQLMSDKSITIEDAAKAAGYSSLRTFIRVFSKSQGITPGKFKEMQR